MSERRDRFQRVEAVFLAAKRLPERERNAFVTEQAGDDHAMAKEILALLEEDARSLGALDRPPLGRADLEALTREAAEAPLPERIGPFRIAGLLGVGGMGAVYEAEQDEPRRLVALKVIRPGLITPALLRRFRRETNALAQLSHPGIARIYEAGAATTDSGETPYFAMELIRGRPLIDFADANALDARRRLSLIADVADALHHAHQHGVVHRDLKPANILVDETGKPRILDFGVSSVSHEAGDDTALHTESGMLLGTLAYMSPEQASGDISRVDHRSDVYALGVIAYELLAGSPPYEIRRDAIHEAARIIREVEPTSLSSMNRTLRGDAETIVFKAISKESDRRYQTAAEFAGDIRRFLANEPILARRPSASYQLAKFARRNRPLFAGIAAAFVILLVSLGVISALLVRTLRAEQIALFERDEANRQAAIADEINDFLVVDLIAAVSPDVTPNRDVTLLDLLDAASRRIDGRFTEQPAVEAALRRTIAITYWDLGRPAAALSHGERAVELFARVYGDQDDRTLMAMANLGDIYRSLRRFDDADRMHSTVLAQQRAKAVRDPSQLVMALFNLGSLRRAQGRFDEALDLLQEASDEAVRKLPESAVARSHARSGLAGLLRERGRLDEAIRIYESLNLTTELTTGLGVPDRLRSLGGLALAYSSARRFEDSERVYREILAVQSDVLGESHHDTIQTETNLSLLLIRMGRHEEAKERLEVLYDRAAVALGPDHQQTLLTGFQLGKSLTNIGRAERAVHLLSDLHARSVGVFGAEYPISLVLCHELARAHNALGNHEQAKTLTARLVDQGLAAWPRLHEAPAYFMQVRADALAGAGEPEEALTLYRDAIAILREVDPQNASISEMEERAASLRRPLDAGDGAPPSNSIK